MLCSVYWRWHQVVVAETPQIPVDSKCSYILEVRTIKELVMSPSIIQELFIISQIALATILPPLLSPPSYNNLLRLT